MQSNPDEAHRALKKMRRSKYEEGKTVHEVQKLDKQCPTAFGEGLVRSVPSYFKDGVKKMSTGCFSSGLQLECPCSDAPLGSASQFQTSSLRAVAQLGIEHAGFKSSVATFTVAMNAWKGILGRLGEVVSYHFTSWLCIHSYSNVCSYVLYSLIISNSKLACDIFGAEPSAVNPLARALLKTLTIVGA